MSWEELSIKERRDLFNEIVNNSFVELSLTYAREYEKNPKNFINCYIKHKSIRVVCKWIVFTYKYIGAFEEVKAQGKDFSNWVNKQNLNEQDKKSFNEVLMIIHSIIHQ